MGGGALTDAEDLLRQWLLLGAWSGPVGAPLGDWPLYLLGDVLLLASVSCALRWLPAVLTRVSVPAIAVWTVAGVQEDVVVTRAGQAGWDGCPAPGARVRARLRGG